MKTEKKSSTDLNPFSFGAIKSLEEAEKQLKFYILAGGFFVVLLPLAGAFLFSKAAGLEMDWFMFIGTQVILIVLLFLVYKYKSRILSLILLANAGGELLIRVYNKLTDQHPAAIILPLLITLIFVHVVRISFYWQKTSTEKKKMHWAVKTLLGIVLVLGIGYAAVTGLINQYVLPTEADKSPIFSERIGNLYKNSKYNFQIEFPEGWEITESDDPHTIQMAKSGQSEMNIVIVPFPPLMDPDTDIREFADNILRGHRNSTNTTLLDSGETTIGGELAIWSQYKEVLDSSAPAMNLLYQTLHNQTSYAIRIQVPENEFDVMKSSIERSVATFEFTD